MKSKNFVLCFVVVFLAIFLSDFVIHQVILKSLYQATLSLWRPESEMQNHMPFMMGGHLVVAFFFTRIFAHGYKGSGVIEGLRYGFMLAGFQAGGQLMMHAVQPFPTSITLSWIGLGFAQAMLVGAILAKIYKKA